VARWVVAGDVAEVMGFDLAVPLRCGPGDVHGARVAVRRLRSDLRTFRSLVDAAWVDARRAELGPVGAALAPIRHIDVVLGYVMSAVEDRPRCDREVGVLATQLLDMRVEACRRLRVVLGGDGFLGSVVELARAASELPVDAHPLSDAQEPAADVLPGLVRRPWRHLKQAAGALDRESGRGADRDDLRVWARHCRYAAEGCAPVLGEAAWRLADAATALHGVLGDLNDATMVARWLDDPPADLTVPPGLRRRLSGMLGEVATTAEAAWPGMLERVLAAKAATQTPTGARPVTAAGGVVWRRGPGGVEVLVVHRPQHGDWSLPKGGAYPGERAEVCALREVEEETGLRCRLGAELLPVGYRNQNGRRKTVRYWAMTPVGGVFTPQAEVDEVRWLPLADALGLVGRARDWTVLAALPAALEVAR
jgi:CHAD domain-containing protein/8-oxo-dGTP pyrophosphatase MutT (NUDIX family)